MIHAADWFPTALPDRTLCAPLAHPPGTLLRERYLLKKPLGVGGMGVVYLAWDQLRDRDLALKCLHPFGAQEERKRLTRELALQESLTHKGVVRTYDLDQDPATGQLFFTMEYIAGASLAEVFLQAKEQRRIPPLPLAQTLQLFGQLSGILKATHQEGVLHRDLKPSNVMLQAKEGGVEVKLLDFGIARSLHTQGRTSTHQAGTPGYMAPEQWDPEGTLTPATDIYGLGLLLYQMMTGANVMMGQLPGPCEWLEDQGAAPALSKAQQDALDQVVLRALHRFAHKRYQDVNAFEEALQQALAPVETDAPDKTEALAQVGPMSVHIDKEARQLTFEAPLSHDTWQALGACEQLHTLSLRGAGVTDSHLVYLSGLGSLRQLHLVDNPLTGDGLCHLQPLRELRALSLGATQLRPDTLGPLCTLPHLEWLSLWNTPCDDASLALLVGCRSLCTLHLSQSAITSACVTSLKQMHSLRKLELWNTALTKQDLASLQEALPHCQIKAGH